MVFGIFYPHSMTIILIIMAVLTNFTAIQRIFSATK